MLRGRSQECTSIEGLLRSAAAGHGGSLVLRGEPGIGKSALLDFAVERASGFRVVRASGVEWERELPYAALQQICAPSLDYLDNLATPQADAVGTALGLRAVGPPDRLLVGLGVLGLLSEVARSQPMLYLIDDAQWIDQASLFALAFCARRVDADSLAIIFGTRESLSALMGLREQIVAGLEDADARALLSSVVLGRMDELVRDQIVAETRGNPLALLELPYGARPGELAGGFGPPNTGAVSNRIEEEYFRRIRALPETTQRLLVVAAAEPLGLPDLLWRAARRLGVGVEDAAPAELDGLFHIAQRTTFRHPLVRSAAYRSATTELRHRAHRALAEESSLAADADRRAWHLAQATVGYDEDVAAELEHSAERARVRGGPAAAAAFLEAAASLTADKERRSSLLLSGAELKYEAGGLREASSLLSYVEAGSLDELGLVRRQRLIARISIGVRRGSDAPGLLLNAARQLETVDADSARLVYLDAMTAAMFVGPRHLGGEWSALAQSAGSAPAVHGPPQVSDLLLDGLALQVTEGYAAGLTPLREALDRLVANPNMSCPPGTRWAACRAAMNLWDDKSWLLVAADGVAELRESGKLGHLPASLSSLTAITLLRGELDASASLIDETELVTAAMGNSTPLHGPLALAAWRGREDDVLRLVRAAGEDDRWAEESIAGTLVSYATALFCNSVGRYQEALKAALPELKYADELGYSLWALVELVEAASRTGDNELASAATEQLIETTNASGSDWALGIGARCRALASSEEGSEELYVESIAHLEVTGVATHLARSHLVYGEWLRREGRRIDARHQLRKAHRMFTSMGAEAFGQRAERELAATGERARQRSVDTSSHLTPQEAEIARLASSGHTNAEIASQMFISARTVEYHLHKVFAKLGISSRNRLARALTSSGDRSSNEPRSW